MSNSDKAIQNERVQIAGSELTMPAPPAEAHWTVYKITAPDGRVYIGQTGQPLRVRWRKGYNCTHRNHNAELNAAFVHYGKASFQVEPLCEDLTQEGAWELETKFIELYDSMNPEKGFNRRTGGPVLGCSNSKTTVERCRRAALKKYLDNPRYREEAREAAKRRTAEGTNPIMYSSRKARPVVCVETGEVYASQNAAARLTGIVSVHKACCGKQNTAGVLHWRFAEEAEVKPEKNRAEET